MTGYLTSLGVTAVELLPIHAKMSEPFLVDKGLPNLLILRCFLDTLGFSLHEPLLLRGVERPTDLLHSQAIAQIERFGLEAAEQATRFYHE